MTGHDLRSKRPENIPTGSKGAKQHTITLGDGDREQLSYIKERLGCSTAEAVRTALRIYAAVLAQQQK